jgi:membrane-bound lytic murein transglycosylase B
MKPALNVFGLLLLLLASFRASGAMEQAPEVQAFIGEMVQRNQFNQDELTRLFRDVHLKQSILDAMDRPAEAKPWSVYRPLFVEPKRIAGGVRFWAAHADTLARAEAQYGVPASMIVAIIGVETFYGRNTGSYRVIDALATLAFAYPKRAPYFRSELEQFLLLSREAGFDPLTIKGSYAGAMGISQFMPSSYRQYGVDFDGDGLRDLWDNADDAIGSVAQYFQGYGWKRGALVVAPVQHVEEKARGLANRGWSFRIPIKDWATVGVGTDAEKTDADAMLLELAGVDGPEYWLGYENFYVITRYNHSFHYAMAAWQLSQALEAARAAALTGRANTTAHVKQ